jgi:cation diffusion facilitator family transporter
VAGDDGLVHNDPMADNGILYREGRRAAAWGIIAALGLGVVKALGGFFGHSLALLSDAVHSLVDAAISGALLTALVVAQRPPDREHPYGHGRAEALAGAGLALVLLLLALGIAWEAITTLTASKNALAPATSALFVAAGCALIQEALFHYSSRIARRTGSRALLATAWDARLDAIGALVVVLGVALAKWGGPAWHWADHAAALVVAATVFWIGGGLLLENVDTLMDRQADPARLDAVRRAADAVPGVLEVETLRMRKLGLEYYVDIHIEVDPGHTVEDGHTIAHAVKDRLKTDVPAIRDVLVHVEPHRPPGSSNQPPIRSHASY